jgi:hypothetical protein
MSIKYEHDQNVKMTDAINEAIQRAIKTTLATKEQLETEKKFMYEKVNVLKQENDFISKDNYADLSDQLAQKFRILNN